MAENLKNQLKETMPVLDDFRNRIMPFNNVTSGQPVLYINHSISDSLLFAVALKSLGVNVWSVLVPYGEMKSAQRKDVVKGFSRIGKVYVPSIDSPDEFIFEMEISLLKALKSIYKYCKTNNKKFLIVEDGGYLLPRLHDKKNFRKYLNYCSGAVEHTSRGMWNYQYMETDKSPKMERFIKVPAVTIASTKLKTFHEPSFVGQAIVDELSYLLKINHDFLNYKKVIVMGAGRVGYGIARILANYSTEITIIDSDKKKLEPLKKFDFSSKKSQELSPAQIDEAQIIIGATGISCLDIKFLQHFVNSQSNKNSKIFLVSASSKNIEFKEIFDLLKLSVSNSLARESISHKLKNVKMSVAKNYGVTFELISKSGFNKKLVFIGDGYPVIFFPSHTNGAPNKAMDPIMTELFTAFVFMIFLKDKLEKRVYLIDEVPKYIKENTSLGLPEEIINIFDEEKIIDLWCEFNDLDVNDYKKRIGFDAKK